MNDLGYSDYMTSVVHALSQVKPLRNFFLDKNNYSYSKVLIFLSFFILNSLFLSLLSPIFYFIYSIIIVVVTYLYIE